MAIASEAAFFGAKIIWGAPTYDQVRIGWDETHKAAADVARFNQARMEAVFPSGGVITYRSLDNPDSSRGHTADGIVVDEAGDVAEPAWYEVLRPMLMDTGGWSWVIGTPKGRTWFWREHQAANDRADSRSWQAPTLGVEITAGGLVRKPHPLENPEIRFEELVHLYQTMPERTFRQEILAEFIEDTGGVFRSVVQAATATKQDKAIPGHTYVCGVDIGRTNDYTVISVIDATTHELVAFDRFSQIDFVIQRARLRALWQRFDGPIIVEDNFGLSVVEDMQRDGLPIQPFHTTNATKLSIVDGLAMAFEQQTLRILPDPTLIAELQAYEQERLPSGLVRFNAPEGMHDDMVMSLALAWYGAAQSGPLFAWGGDTYDDA